MVADELRDVVNCPQGGFDSPGQCPASGEVRHQRPNLGFVLRGFSVHFDSLETLGHRTDFVGFFVPFEETVGVAFALFSFFGFLSQVVFFFLHVVHLVFGVRSDLRHLEKYLTRGTHSLLRRTAVLCPLCSIRCLYFVYRVVHRIAGSVAERVGEICEQVPQPVVFVSSELLPA